ncbi:MAG: DNA recombination protein RmuC [uncultured Acidimicrobiales bacterium]|uniref:DNA recombination protein RmuC n=1 Tax=uncultured Acidimicrobiales bacterium TaxID=310071 RepID=A0A6J4H3V9_9ACTN|nr:MAG: DNA recombination protein RmuC [uncultured Acidimicrobiales bacterium]
MEVVLLVAFAVLVAAVSVLALLLAQARAGAGRSGGAIASAVGEQLGAMSARLEALSATVVGVERERARDHGQLREQVEAAARQAGELGTTTAALRQALANPKARGQWGERMADDVLRAAGLVEGVSYVKQRPLPHGTVPDVTFFLPQGLVLHMDVKFPVAAYLRHLEAATAHEAEGHRATFLRDVRDRVSELTTRGYVDPAGGTVDYVLCFIPNESVYAFIHEHDPDLLDFAIGRKVVCCSPLTLFAVLAVIRQAVDAFAVQRTSDDIISALAGFSDQWERFCGAMDKVGRSFDGVQRSWEELAGPRRRALDKRLDRVDELRRSRALPADGGAEEPSRLRAVSLE